MIGAAQWSVCCFLPSPATEARKKYDTITHQTLKQGGTGPEACTGLSEGQAGTQESQLEGLWDVKFWLVFPASGNRQGP